MNTRMSAQERRDEIVAAATIEFAAGGYSGTSTSAIARRVGVSQPYLFQIFGTKQDLFLAVVRDCFERTATRFEETARAARASGRDGAGVLGEMGSAYVRMLLADRNRLRVQLHAYAACGNPEIRAVVREEFLNVWKRVATASAHNPASLVQWFAQGMLINVIASIGDARTLEEFYADLPGARRVEA